MNIISIRQASNKLRCSMDKGCKRAGAGEERERERVQEGWEERKELTEETRRD